MIMSEPVSLMGTWNASCIDFFKVLIASYGERKLYCRCDDVHYVVVLYGCCLFGS